MNYLNKVKIKELLPFFLGFFLSFCLINYKFFILDLLLDNNYESLDYIRPAKIFYDTNSFSLLLESLYARLPAYPLLISSLFNFFGEESFISILFFQSVLHNYYHFEFVMQDLILYQPSAMKTGYLYKQILFPFHNYRSF